LKTIQVVVRGLIIGVVFVLFTVAIVRAEDNTITIEMFDKPAKFNPEDPKISVGQTVKWINKGETVHTVTDDPSQAPDPNWVISPAGAEELDSGYLNAGETYSYTFKVPGVYKYFCLTHEQEGMKGEIDVNQ
jgi:plastocyanin